MPLARRQALERAVSLHQNDNMAKLCLDLSLHADGHRVRRLSAIERGLTGLRDGLDDVNQYAAFS
jgi:hypothetical protein